MIERVEDDERKRGTTFFSCLIRKERSLFWECLFLTKGNLKQGNEHRQIGREEERWNVYCSPWVILRTQLLNRREINLASQAKSKCCEIIGGAVHLRLRIVFYVCTFVFRFENVCWQPKERIRAYTLYWTLHHPDHDLCMTRVGCERGLARSRW